MENLWYSRIGGMPLKMFWNSISIHTEPDVFKRNGCVIQCTNRNLSYENFSLEVHTCPVRFYLLEKPFFCDSHSRHFCVESTLVSRKFSALEWNFQESYWVVATISIYKIFFPIVFYRRWKQLFNIRPHVESTVIPETLQRPIFMQEESVREGYFLESQFMLPILSIVNFIL